MENFLIYIGKSALAAGAFYIVFLALFQNRKQFVFNRFYLPVSLALSFIIPLITFTTVKYIEPISSVESNIFTFISAHFNPVADRTAFQSRMVPLFIRNLSAGNNRVFVSSFNRAFQSLLNHSQMQNPQSF